MAAFKELEAKLNDVFGKKAPKLPKGGKEFIVNFAPILALVLGIITLLTTISLWKWAHVVHTYSRFAGQVCTASGAGGCNDGTVSRLTFWVWASLLLLTVEGILYLLAFPGLQARRKRGWDYMYSVQLINIVYAVALLFSIRGGVGGFTWNLLLSGFGFWLLFQVRPYYTGEKVVVEPSERPRRRPTKPAPPNN